MSHKNMIVAVGLLTQNDLERLGAGFNAMFPVEHTDDFQHLIDAIDRADTARRTSRPEQRADSGDGKRSALDED